MIVADLQKLLSSIQGGTFSITATQLDIADVTTLFSNYLGGSTLTLTDATGDAARLTAGGRLSLSNTDLPAKVVFVADSTNTNVVGIVITADLPGWTWTSPDVQVTANSIGTYLSSPQLAFQAGGAIDAPGAVLSGQISITSESGAGSFTMAAPIPVPDASNPQPLVFSGDPNVTLSDPGALSQFVEGASFSVIPEGIPIASSLTLSQIELNVGPNIDAITQLLINIGSDEGITIVKDVFVIDSFTFTFVVQFPGTSTTVYGSATTTMDLNGVDLTVTALFPSLYIQGALAKAIPLKTFLAKFIDVSSVPDDFEISDLMFGIGLSSPYPWQFQIGLSNLWKFEIWKGQYFIFEQLLINASGASGATPTLLIYSAYSVADTQLYLSAAEDSGNWTFSGGTVGYQVINFIPLLDDLARQFGLDASTLPSSLTALDLTTIQLTYTTGSEAQEFVFACSGSLAVSDVAVATTLDLDIKSTSSSGTASTFTIDFKGTLSITVGTTTVEFTTVVDVSPTQTVVLGTLNSENTPLTLGDLLGALGFNAQIPDGIDISLEDLGIVYQSQPGRNEGDISSTFIVTANSNYGGAMFIAMKQTRAGSSPSTTTTYVFAVNPAIRGSLADIPLIGTKIPSSLDLSLDGLQILFASAALTADQVAAIDALLGQLAQYLPAGSWQLAAGPLNNTVELSMTLSVAGSSTPFVLDIGSSSTAAATTPLLGAGDASGAHYLSIQKSIGPLFFDRVGFEYSGGDIEFLLDASLSFSAVSISLMGLSLESPLTSFQPSFGLQGLGLELAAGPLSITGSFLSTTPNGLNDPDWEYAGNVAIQAEGFGLAGLGAYGKFSGNTSFFIFVMLDAPLGGPSFFFVTGLAAGFGYNRNLEVPTLSALPSFPLVAAAMAGETGDNPFQGMTNDPGAALQVLEQYLGPSVGEDWAAVGVRFNSFELLQSFALVTLSFGTRFEVALLGLSVLTVPTLDPSPIAYVELALEVVFAPDDGLLAVAAQLTPASYLFAKACHLTGGFAFYTWFKDNAVTGAKAGDFVVSVGGYFPGYDVPKYYPSVPTVGANWQVDSKLSIKGDFYFALIPSAVMAGGYISATWQSGSLKAWFNTDANFLLSWKPFHYQADMSLSLGASYHLRVGFLSHTFTVHVGVDLSLWGPSFSGVAHVDLDVISFTISFGGTNFSIQPISWTDFKSSFLPPPSSSSSTTAVTPAGSPTPTDTYCLVKVAAGLRKDLTQTPNPLNLSWVIDPEKFQLATSSVFPITSASLVSGNQTTPLAGCYPNNFGVGPVGVANGDLSSQHVITINKITGLGFDPGFVLSTTQCTITQVTANVPAAPWSKAMSLDLVTTPNISAVNSTPSTIDGLATGFSFVPNVVPPHKTPDPIDLEVLEESPADISPTFSWSPTAVPDTDPFDQSQALSQFMSTLTNTDVAATRSDILALLIAQGVPVNADINVADLAASAEDVLLAPPVLSYLGEERAPSPGGSNV